VPRTKRAKRRLQLAQQIFWNERLAAHQGADIVQVDIGDLAPTQFHGEVAVGIVAFGYETWLMPLPRSYQEDPKAAWHPRDIDGCFVEICWPISA
jgi:hypothetical protein